MVRACARMPHCTFAKVNAGRTFGTLKTADDAYLEGVAAEAAAKKRRELSSCVLAGGKDAGAPDPHADEKARLRAEMAAGRGTAYFVHIQNAGGTSMCKMAQRNGLAAPQESPEESGVFGRNCNPSSAEAKRIWKGDVAAQRAWRQGSSYRFVANEMALPPQLAFGDFLYVVVVRHPRELALARFRGSPMYHRDFDDRKLAAFLKRGIRGGGGVHNVMTRQLCGCLDSPALAECGHGEWHEEGLRAFKLATVGQAHLDCAKRRLDRFSLVLVTDMLHAAAPLLQAELGWRDTGLLQRKVNRQAGCDAQQMYGNDSAVAEGLQHAYSLDLQLYAHARMLFCRALAGATSTTP